MDRFNISEGRQAPGRNATDIALAIDAIDLLHERAIDTFCIVSNDRDYEPLAARLRKSGRRAVLMTFNKQVPQAARKAWDHCVWLGRAEGVTDDRSASPVAQGEAGPVQAYLAAHARVPDRDGGWVRLTDLGKAVEKSLRVKAPLKWLNGQPEFVVGQRHFNGKGPEVHCVRLRET